MKTTDVSEGSLVAGHRVVFCLDSKEIQIRDVLDAAWVRGELDEDWQRLLAALASAEHADAAGLEAEDAALQTMAEEFRYERDLLTAEETEQWLQIHQISEEEFSGFFLRRHWHNQFGEDVESATLEFPVASPELRELLRIDLVLSGRFTRHARSLAWRLNSLQAPGTTLSLASEIERKRFLERTGYTEDSLPAALAGLGHDARWIEECLGMESEYQRVCDALLTTDKRSRLLAAQRLALTQLELETFSPESSNAANEAVLCLRENQATMQELAAECGAACERLEVFLGDCSEALQRVLLSASPGEVLAPLAEGDSFVVCRLLSKTDPTIADERVKARLDRHLLEAHFSQLAGKIRWTKGWERMA